MSFSSSVKFALRLLRHDTRLCCFALARCFEPRADPLWQFVPQEWYTFANAGFRGVRSY